MPKILVMGFGSGKTSMRPPIPRRAERFATNTLECKVGTVRDVSETGFRLSSRKKLGFNKGEIHDLQVRTVDKQLTIKARVQWVRRTCWLPAVYEAGFQIIDPRPGVGYALRQLGQFGFANGNEPISGEQIASGQTQQKADKSAQPDRPQAFINFEDLYGVLGVALDSTHSEIKSAYRKLAQVHHPDHSDSPDAAERFDKIAKAYSVLGDSKRRDWYDKMVSGGAAA
jgi:hypothetical protein